MSSGQLRCSVSPRALLLILKASREPASSYSLCPLHCDVYSKMLAVVQKRFMGKGIKLRGFSTQTRTYTKPLNPPAISFETKEGGAMLSEAMAEGTAEGSLKLLANYGMQRDLNFCGPASLCTVLNALCVDPKRAWKGPWRWFEDHMVGDSEIMGNTGDGHFSPMAAYHKGRDMLLILDVARYKYPFHWLPWMTVWDAMNQIDKETGETRVYDGEEENLMSQSYGEIDEKCRNRYYIYIVCWWFEIVK
ncbi:unnamed protein product [Camellia sinensis]